MRLAIDASSTKGGGVATHLVELLKMSDPVLHGFSEIYVWAPKAMLSKLAPRSWLVKCHEPVLEKNFLRRAIWQGQRLGRLAQDRKCDLLFVVNSSFATDFRPVVTMSRNLLPFAWVEMWRFGLSLATLKYLLLRRVHSFSFRKASGVIFLTRHAEESVKKVTGPLRGQTVVIPHGVDDRFFIEPRIARSLAEYSMGRPLQVLYVSTVDNYKHQWNVVEAVARLRSEGLPLSLVLIGSAYAPALRRLQKTLGRIDPQGSFIRYLGVVPYEELHAYYATADIGVFASSCENLPNALLEGMAAGLPMACSNRRPMPDILSDAGVYFDPEDPDGIAQAIKKLMESPEMRAHKAQAAYRRARQYSWKRCADETFGFLARVAAANTSKSGG